MINVHYHAKKPLPKLILVDTCKGVATHANTATLAVSYRNITGNPFFCWAVDGDVGDYICSYDDFQQLYPEYFI